MCTHYTGGLRTSKSHCNYIFSAAKYVHWEMKIKQYEIWHLHTELNFNLLFQVLGMTEEMIVKRVGELESSVTETVFNYTRRGLFEKDKLTIASMLCLSVLKVSLRRRNGEHSTTMWYSIFSLASLPLTTYHWIWYMYTYTRTEIIHLA